MKKHSPAVAAVGIAALLGVACAGPDVVAPAAGGAPGTPSPRTPSSTSRPNIVFVLTDDQDASVVNMDRLRARVAAEGLTFDRHFASVPLCGPARVTLLTGLHAHTHGVRQNRGADGGFEAFRQRGLEGSTLATWLRAAGYRTGFVGKYVNRYPGDSAGADPGYVPPGWDHFAAFHPPDRGSGSYYDYFVTRNGTVTFYPEQPADYITDHVAREALRFVDELPERNAPPFFLHVTPNAPHAPPRPAPRHAGAFSGLSAPRTGAFNEADVSDKPPYYQQLPLLDAQALARLDDLYRGRQETLLAVDELVDALLRRLDERGLLANTYVFFASDNGFMLGQHRYPQGKDTPYEESIRVPLLVRGPGVPRGAVLTHLVSNVDVPVTIAELAGAELPAHVEGRSFAPLLRAGAPPPEAWRTEVLIEHWSDDADAVPSYAGLRTRDYTYVEYTDTGDVELYDLQSDPGQEENLAGKADPALAAALAKRLGELRDCRAAACR